MLQDPPNAPFFSPDLIGANGKLQRLHKGEPPPPIAPPPPVRDTNRQVAAEGESARRAASLRRGYASTIEPKANRSLLSTGGYDTPNSRSLL